MGSSRPFIGVDGIKSPKWAATRQAVVEAGWWDTIRSVPAAVATVARFSWEASRTLTLVAAVLHVLSGCVTAFGLLATADVLTKLLEQGPTPERVLASLPAIALVAGAFAFGALLDAAVALVQGMLTPQVELAASERMHEAVLGVEAAAFDDADFRELVRQGGERGTHSIRMSTEGVADLLSSIVSMVAAMATVSVFSPWLLPAMVLAAAVDGWAAMRAAKLNYESFLQMITRDRQSFVISDLITDRDAALEVRAFTTQPVLLAEYQRVAKILATESIRVERRQTWIQLVGRALAGVGTALGYLVLGWLLYVEAMPLALAGAAVIAMRTGSTALRNTIYQVNRLYEHSFHIDLYRKLLVDAATRRGPEPVAQAPVNPATIELRDVSYTYPGQDSPALQEISLKIRRGQVIALVGENGSGKSTLGKLITGLYRPTEGRIHWDGVDVELLDPRSVGDRVGMVAQEPVRWPHDARTNVRLGRPGRDDPGDVALRAAAAFAGADEVVAELPNGWSTLLSKYFRGGTELSGGQWQRIAVARGLFRDARLLVLDEPTAALDAKAEWAVYESLRQLAVGRTVVLITHRLGSVRNADRIYLLHKGELTEQGTHDELMTAGGRYAELYRLQADMYAHP